MNFPFETAEGMQKTCLFWFGLVFPPSEFHSTSICVEIIDLDLRAVNFAYTAISSVAVNYRNTQVIVTEGA